MKIGVIARLDLDRGLGIQTQDMIRNYGCSKVLWVEMGDEQMAVSPSSLCLQAEGLRVRYNERTGLPSDAVEWLVEGMDIIYSVETFYDDNLIRSARRQGVRTVLHTNLELFSVHNERPSAIWAPTPWAPITMRGSRELTGYVQVPTPEPESGVAPRPAEPGDRLQVLFIQGRTAMEDRNGQHIIRAAMSQVRNTVEVFGARELPEPERPLIEDRWSMYEGMHLLVLPRRYGGLCLTALEAIRCGLGVIMPDCSPNEIYSTYRTEGALVGPPIRMKGGHTRMFNADPLSLAIQLDTMAAHPYMVEAAQQESRNRAQALSWEALRPTWDKAFELAALRRP